MKIFLPALLLMLGSLPLLAQSDASSDPTFELQKISGKEIGGFPIKMLCDPLTNPIDITSCAGENTSGTPPTGDNNPQNGAFMNWTAVGSNNLYYSRIYSNLDTFQIVQGGTSNSVYQPAADGSYTGNLNIGGNSSNQCLEPGTWTVQVWDVIDLNGDLLPDRDANGNIIGCFTECVFDFFPSCPTTIPFGAETIDVGCIGSGSIQITDFVVNQLYCVDQNGGGATFNWTGPGGFTATGSTISGLAAGLYTVVVSDFYGCQHTLDIQVVVADPVQFTCANPVAPGIFAGSDGSFDVDITAGTGDYTISWTGPDNGSQPGVDGTNTITGLPAGTYTVTVTDNDSGCDDVCTITIPDPPCEITFSVALDNLGNVVITVTGGVPSFFVSFSGTATASQDDLGPYSQTIITLSANLFEAGEYFFTIYEEDRPDCSVFEQLIIEGPDCSTLEFTLESLTEISCGGTDSGEIEISFTGGENPTISWIGPGVNGETTPTISNLGPGTYSFQVIDENGCFVEDTYELIAPPALIFDCAGVDETCPDADDGKIGLTITGGTGPYTLNYNGLDPDGTPLEAVMGLVVTGGDTIRDLPPGDYFLQLFDDNGCSIECSTVVEEFICPFILGGDQSVQIDSIMDATRVDTTGGVILFFEGTPDWTYQIISTTGGLDTTITTSTSPDTAIHLPIDTYRLVLILATDPMDPSIPSCCTIAGGPPITFIVRGPDCMLDAIGDTQDPSCAGEASGSINLIINGAIGDVTIDWGGALGNSPFLGGLPEGGYQATITDEAGCEFITPIYELFDPPPFSVALAGTDIACGGDSTGTLTAQVFNEVGSVDYDWSVPGAPNSPSLTGMPAGTYTVTAIDDQGCSSLAFFTLNEPAALSLSCGTTDESNVGTSDGNVFFDLAGGTTPYTFTLNSTPIARPALDTFQMLAPGVYTIQVTDGNGCSTSCTAIINAGGCGDFSLDLAVTPPDCGSATGSAMVTPVMDNGGVTFAWEHGPTTAVVTDLAAGDYSVTATDAFSCLVIQQFTIDAFTDIPGITFEEFAIVCDDDCAEVDYIASGTGPFAIFCTIDRAGTQVQEMIDNSNAVGTFTLCPQNYGFPDLNGTTVTIDSIQDANGCVRPVGTSRDATAFPQAIGVENTIICASDTFFLAGEAFHADRLTGDVVLPNASVNGCDSTVSVTIDFFAPDIGVENTVICASDTFFLAGEAFHADRLTGDVVLPNASVNGCDSTVTVTIDFFAPDIGVENPVICASDTFFIAGEAFHADRLTGDVVLPNASVNGCDSTVSVTIDFFAPDIGVENTVICASDTFFIAGEAFHADRLTGDVVLPNASVNGCDSTVSVSLSFFPQLMGTLDTTICTGTSFNYAGRSFDEAVNDELVTLNISSANGCDSLVSVTVRLREVPTVVISGDGIVCDDGILSIDLTYNGPGEANIELSSNSGDIISIVAGTTTIQRPVPVGTVVTIINVEDGGPCQLVTSGSITVSQTDLTARIDVMSGDGTFAVSCADGSDGEVVAVPSGGQGPFTFDWNNGMAEASLQGLETGDYSLIITSGRGCRTSASISLNAPEVMAVQLAEVQATCLDPIPGLVIRNIGGGVGPYVYSTDGGDSFLPVTAFPDTVMAQIGTTVFTLEDSKGCPLTQSFEFAPAPEGDIRVTPAQSVIVFGDSVEIVVLTDLNAAGYRLTPGPEELITQPSFFVSPTETTNYIVTVVDSAGCEVSGGSLVVVDHFVPVYAPNAFSPNEDGINDVFRIYGQRNVASFSNFTIFDRWGNRVFDFAGPVGPNDERWGWDGRALDGRLRQTGVYVFTVTVSFEDGTTREVKGDLVLLR
jgi:gliding motility-associated-like protein